MSSPVAGSGDSGILPRELILASAGTGKTFALSSRMIGLLALGAEADTFLASTFTRKAAGEILERVLVRLARAAMDVQEAEALARHASLSSGAESAIPGDPDFFLDLLRKVVRNLHRLDVSTLDSFFIRVARAFPGELGMPEDWEIADEASALRLESEALDRVVRDTDPRRMTELLRMTMRGKAGRRVHDYLLGQLEDLREAFHELEQEGQDPWRPFGDLSTDSRGVLAGVEEAVAALSGVDLPRTKSGKPSASYRKAVAQGITDLEAGGWEAFCRRGLGRKILQAEDSYGRIPIPSDVREAVDTCLDVARRALTREIDLATRALGRLVRSFDDALAGLQRRRGAFRFRDVTLLLAGEDPVSARPDLWYRLDRKARHLLLDEFQDTALLQWEALRPLAHEILSGYPRERSLVVVADPKQSIYGWRGAEPLMVHRVGESLGLAHRTLDRSWRSSRVVLDFVNTVFEDLGKNPGWGEDEGGPRVATEWLRDFPRHEAARDLQGHVRVKVGPRDANLARTDRPRMMRWAAEEIRGLLNSAPGATVGVLVRTNQAVARLITELRSLGIDASEEGATSLTDSPAVSTILALLRFADHPGDTLARYQVARSPLGDVLGLPETDGEGSHPDGREIATDIRKALLDEGYGDLFTRWTRELTNRETLGSRDLRRLLQLVELGYRWDSRPTLRTTDFVHFVQTERTEATSDARVRVMTVHKAKGLEFDLVVLPELDLPLKGRGRARAVLPLRNPETGRVKKVFPRVGKDVRGLFPEIEAAALQEADRETRDALGVLYVALTRARHALHLFLAEDPEPGDCRSPTFATLVRGALGRHATPLIQDETLLEEGRPDWPEEELVREKEETPTLLSPPALAGGGSRRLLAHESPSSLLTAGVVDLGRLLPLVPREGRLRGTVVHAWLEDLVWIDEWSPSREALREVAHREAPGLGAGAVDELMDEMEAWLTEPQVRAALRRDAYPPGARVETELPFAVRLDEVVLQGRMDRVVLMESGGEVREAHVLDYKTDVLARNGGGEGLSSATEKYRIQIDAYRRALARLHGLSPRKVRASLVFVREGTVVDIEATEEG